MIAWVDTLQSFVPDLRRLTRQTPDSAAAAAAARSMPAAPRAPRVPLRTVSVRNRRCLQGNRLTQRACPGIRSSGRPFLLASAPQPRAYSGRRRRRSRARWPPRPACPCVLSLPAFARALWTPAASPLCSAAPRASLPRLKQKPLDACDPRVVLGWDSAFARRAAHDPPGSRRDACSCKP